MTAINDQKSHQMIARLQADPEIRAIMARNDFEAAISELMVLDLNVSTQDHRHRLGRQWCEALAGGRWRRRIVERQRHARLDRVYFDFEDQRDASAFSKWLTEHGW